MSASALLRVRLGGPFRMELASGEGVPLKSRKGRALVAALALSPDMRRSRVWLQNLLWGSCGREEAQASLRREIMQLRRALPDVADRVLTADRETVGLAADAVALEVDLSDGREFLEGLDLPGEEEFEDWLRLQRQRLAPAAAAAAPAREETPALPSRLRVALIGAQRGEGGEPLIARVISRVGAALLAAGMFDVFEYDAQDVPAQDPGGRYLGADLLVHCILSMGPDGAAVCTKVSDPGSSRLLGTAVHPLPSLNERETARRSFDAPAAWVVETMVHGAERASGTPEARTAATLALGGIHLLFKADGRSFPLADRQLQEAFDLRPSGVFLAWRALLRVFMAGERAVECPHVLREEAGALVQSAMSLNPGNGLVCALVAQCEAFVLRRHAVAVEHADRAVLLSPQFALVWAIRALVHAYVGSGAVARSSAARAQQLGWFSPYRYYYDTASCIAAVASNDLAGAIKFGRAAHAARPSFRPPMRYLVSSLALSGQLEEALLPLRSLLQLEPDLSAERVRESTYPVPSLHLSDFIRNGFHRALEIAA